MTSDGISKSTPTAPKQMVNRNCPQVTRQLTSAAECEPSTWRRKRTGKARQVCGNIKNAAVASAVIKAILHFPDELSLRRSSRGAPLKTNGLSNFQDDACVTFDFCLIAMVTGNPSACIFFIQSVKREKKNRIV